MEKKILVILVAVILLIIGVGYLVIQLSKTSQPSNTDMSSDQSTESNDLTTSEIDSLAQDTNDLDSIGSELDMEDIDLDVNLD